MPWLVYLKDGKWKAIGPIMYLKSSAFEPQGVVGYTEEEFAKLPNGQDVAMTVNESDLSDLGKSYFANLIGRGTLLITAKKVGRK